MENTSYSLNNVTNYAIYLLNNGLSVGDKIRKNRGFGKAGEDYTVTEITEEEIKAESESGKPLTIRIEDCGSYPQYIK